MTEPTPYTLPEGWESMDFMARTNWGWGTDVDDDGNELTEHEKRWRQQQINDFERDHDATADDLDWDVKRELRRLRVRDEAARLYAAVSDDGSGWAPESLVDAEPVPPASVLEIAPGDFLLRRGWTTLVHGSFGSGKTPLCYLAVVEQVKAGHLGMIIDYEMGRSNAAALLRELGLDDRQIEEGIYYRGSPGPLTSAGRARVVEEVAAITERTGRQLTVATIDSLTQSMATVPGSSDNDAQDVTVWFDSTPSWLRDQFNAAVIVIDHSGVGDGPRPSGSHKKREAVQFHLWCAKGTPFARTHEKGYSRLEVHKDRSGQREIGREVARLRTRLGGSFYLEQPQGPTLNTVTGNLVLPLADNPDLKTQDEVYADVVASPGVLTTALTGRGEVGKSRRKALRQLENAGRVVSQKVGRGDAWFPAPTGD